MTKNIFDYEDVFMGVREQKPTTYLLTFRQEYRLRSLVKSVTLKKGKILDMGCGGGRISETLPYYYPKADVYGCDVSKTALDYAKKFGSGKVRYDQIKNKRLPYNDNFFDVCICLDVLEHVPDVNYLLNEIRRILKKGGNFFLIVPCEGQSLTFTWFFRKLHFGQDLTYRYFGHIHPEFTHKYVVSLLRKHGFNIRKSFYSEHAFYQLMHLFIFYLPKAILSLFLGDKIAHEYTNSSLIRKPKNKFTPLMLIRKFWFAFFDFMMTFPMYYETIILRRVPMTAHKIHVLSTNIK